MVAYKRSELAESLGQINSQTLVVLSVADVVLLISEEWCLSGSNVSAFT